MRISGARGILLRVAIAILVPLFLKADLKADADADERRGFGATCDQYGYDYYYCDGNYNTLDDGGFYFPFGCQGRSTFHVMTTPVTIKFSSEDTNPECDDVESLSFTPYFGFEEETCLRWKNNDAQTIGVYYPPVNGITAVVVEISSIATPTPQDTGILMQVATVQVWLFPNGTIGVVYHLSGEFFASAAQACYKEGKCQSLLEDPHALLEHEAYMFIPQANNLTVSNTTCHFNNPPIFTTVPWSTAPDICLNGGNSRLDYRPEGYYAQNSDYNDPNNVQYSHKFKVCPTENAFDEFADPESRSPSDSHSVPNSESASPSESASQTTSPSESPSLQTRSDSESQTESPSVSQSESSSMSIVDLSAHKIVDGFVTYEHCAEPVNQIACCSHALPIGFAFQFGCRNFTEFQATTSPVAISLRNPHQHTVHCDGAFYMEVRNWIALLYDINGGYEDGYEYSNVLAFQGGVGSYNVAIGGSHYRVIEWSGIVAENRQDNFERVGTLQLWLFPNGTFGIVTHLTGRFFGGWTVFCINLFDCFPIDEDRGPPFPNRELWEISDAWLFYPDTDCDGFVDYGEDEPPELDFDFQPWFDPPNYCFNPIREDAPDDYQTPIPFVGGDVEDYADAEGVHHLDLCPVDRGFGRFSNQNSPSISESPDILAFATCENRHEGFGYPRDCCFAEFEIGYEFPIGCDTFTTARPFNTDMLLFGVDGTCFGATYVLQVSMEAELFANRGGVGVHFQDVDGQSVRVVEYSGLMIPVSGPDDGEPLGQTDNRAMKAGTMQMWLFRNGSIGVVLHLTGESFYLAIEAYRLDGDEIHVDIGEDNSLLHHYESLMLIPDPGREDECSPQFLAVYPWPSSPPDVCLNPQDLHIQDGDSDSNFGGVTLVNHDQLIALFEASFATMEEADYYWSGFKSPYRDDKLQICAVDSDWVDGDNPFVWPFLEYDDECYNPWDGGVDRRRGVGAHGRRGIAVQEYNCCTVAAKIGFTFAFGCNTYTHFRVRVDGTIFFGHDADMACYPDGMTALLNVNENIHLLSNNGGIGAYRMTAGYGLEYSGSPVTLQDGIAIEWSGVLVEESQLDSYEPFGTIQLWLFRNSTIGLAYHITGQDFKTEIVTCFPDSGCNLIREDSDEADHDAELVLRIAPAFLLQQPFAGQERCADPPHVYPWVNPPNFCLNPPRYYDEENSEEIGIEINSADSEGAPRHSNVSGLPYQHLVICPVEHRYSRFASQTTSPSPSISASESVSEEAEESDSATPHARPAVSKQTGAIVGGVVGGVAISALFALVFLALL